LIIIDGLFENIIDILSFLFDNVTDNSDLLFILFSPYYGSQWCPSTVWLPIFYKISSFVFSRRNKFI